MVLAKRVRFSSYISLWRHFGQFSTVLHRSCRFVPLPKSVTPNRIKSNAEIYDFSLGSEDITLLDDLDLGKAGAISWNPVDVP